MNQCIKNHNPKKVKIAVVGMGFGAEFVPIYQSHPDVSEVAIIDSNPATLRRIANKFGIDKTYLNLETFLKESDFDAVHLVTPIDYHAPQTVAVLNSGRHCACTIPMGLSFIELSDIISARRKSGKNYMMMETAVYTREFLYIAEKYSHGEMGRIQYMRCAHYQDMEYWPDYWKGFPPLMHPTHAVAPCLMLAGKRPEKVFGIGSGKIREELTSRYNSPFAFEAAFIALEKSDIYIEMERYLFEVARAYTECFHVYGSKQSFEWQQLEHEKPLLFNFGEYDGHRGLPVNASRLTVPDFAHLLPEEIRKFTFQYEYTEDRSNEKYLAGGGHGGSHPHLVHEFIRSIIEERPAAVDDITAAYWTGVGICAHMSAIEGGRHVEVPRFEDM